MIFTIFDGNISRGKIDPASRPVSRLLMAATPQISVNQKDNNPIMKENKRLRQSPITSVMAKYVRFVIGMGIFRKNKLVIISGRYISRKVARLELICL